MNRCCYPAGLCAARYDDGCRRPTSSLSGQTADRSRTELRLAVTLEWSSQPQESQPARRVATPDKSFPLPAARRWLSPVPPRRGEPDSTPQGRGIDLVKQTEVRQ